MAKSYMAFNGAAVTTAAPASITTGTAIKTLMQIATPSTEDLKVIEWGISFDGFAAAQAIKVELIDTSVAATVTAYGASDIVKWNRANDAGSLMTLGTTASGFTASAEGTVVATTRILDEQLIPPSSAYVKQFALGREPMVPVSRFLRIRVTAPAAVNAYCYIIWEE